jgi:hypothetical protein
MTFWTDPRMDTADEHAYLSYPTNPTDAYHDHSIEDSALSTRQMWELFKSYGVNKPTLRGETGVFNGGWEGGWYPDVLLDTGAVYEHKKLWTHVGLEGYQCDGQWNTVNLKLNNNWRMYGNYNRYMEGEPVSNGHYYSIGTDLSGVNLVTTTNTNIRAYGMEDVSSTTFQGTPLAAAGRLLLWVDNKNDTWRNVVDGVSIPAVSGQLTISGLPQGTYNIEWWDTEEGEITGHTSATAGGTGQLTFSVSNLETDLAVKVSNAGTNPVAVEFQPGFSERPEAGEVLDLLVVLSSASAETVTVDYEVLGGTAEGDGVDYLLDGGTLEFLPGETEQTIQVTIVDDPDEESDETIEIGLSCPVNAVMGGSWKHIHVIMGSEQAGSSGWEVYR